MKTICYVTISPMIHERRNLNQMKLLQEMGFRGILLALWEEGLPERETIYSTEIIRLKIRNPVGGKMKFIEFNYRVCQVLRGLSFDLLHVHELWPLAGAIQGLGKRKIAVIYDAHEFFMGIEVFNIKKKEKWFWYLVERYYTRFADALITVSEPHRRIYIKAYNHFLRKDSMVLYNVPEKIENLSDSTVAIQHLPEKFIIFQGLFRPGRGIIPMIQSMQYVKDVKLLLCGYGELEQEIRRQIKDLNLKDKILFYGRFTPEEILPVTRKALAGIVLFEPTSINYRYAMPNKFFEYIQAEIPLIASNLATFRSIINTYQIGVLVNRLTPIDIADAINEIVAKHAGTEQMNKSLSIAREIFNWDVEKQKLSRLYLRLLK